MKYSINELVNLLKCEIKGDLSLEYVSGLAPFFQAQEDSITFASDEKFLIFFLNSKISTFLLL